VATTTPLLVAKIDALSKPLGLRSIPPFASLRAMDES
jgi:hypothetical protein